MKIKIDIKYWDSNDVIFSYTCEDNTVKKTVEEAVKQGINLAYAELSRCDLSECNLTGANLFRANLYSSNLYLANLAYANLDSANLANANLGFADLMRSILCYADLSNADLSNAHLTKSDLNMAFCNNTNLNNAVGLNDQCPKIGSFIGWKSCILLKDTETLIYIVKLEIPVDAKRSSSTGKKCRCSKAKVLEIQNLDGTKADIDEVQSWHDPSFKYKIGEIVEVPDFNENCWEECTSGIHFFINYRDAINYCNI